MLKTLRNWLYCHGKNIQFENLPPTIASGRHRILQAFHSTNMLVSCLDDKRQLLHLTKFGYSNAGEWFVPIRFLVIICFLVMMIRCQTVHVASVPEGSAFVMWLG